MCGWLLRLPGTGVGHWGCPGASHPVLHRGGHVHCALWPMPACQTQTGVPICFCFFFSCCSWRRQPPREVTTCAIHRTPNLSADINDQSYAFVASHCSTHPRTRLQMCVAPGAEIKLVHMHVVGCSIAMIALYAPTPGACSHVHSSSLPAWMRGYCSEGIVMSMGTLIPVHCHEHGNSDSTSTPLPLLPPYICHKISLWCRVYHGESNVNRGCGCGVHTKFQPRVRMCAFAL